MSRFQRSYRWFFCFFLAGLIFFFCMPFQVFPVFAEEDPPSSSDPHHRLGQDGDKASLEVRGRESRSGSGNSRFPAATSTSMLTIVTRQLGPCDLESPVPKFLWAIAVFRPPSSTHLTLLKVDLVDLFDPPDVSSSASVGFEVVREPAIENDDRLTAGSEILSSLIDSVPDSVPDNYHLSSWQLVCAAVSPAPPPAPSQQEVWSTLREEAAIEVVPTNPDTSSETGKSKTNVITGMPVYLWYEGKTRLGPLSLGLDGWEVTAEAEIQEYRWDMGDGSPLRVSSKPGSCTPDAKDCPNRAVQHTYLTKDPPEQTIPLTLSTIWCGVATLTYESSDIAIQEQVSLGCVEPSRQRELHRVEVRGVPPADRSGSENSLRRGKS